MTEYKAEVGTSGRRRRTEGHAYVPPHIHARVQL